MTDCIKRDVCVYFRDYQKLIGLAIKQSTYDGIQHISKTRNIECENCPHYRKEPQCSQE